MRIALAIAGWIGAVNERIGRFACWLTLVMVLVGSYNAIVRYLGRSINIHLSSNAYLEFQWYLFSAVFLLGAAYTLKHNAHVRVDILFSQFPARRQAWINVIGHTAFLVPFCILMLWVSWAPVRNSWAILEMSPDPGGLPRYPIKALIPIAFMLLLLQALADIVRQIAFLKGDVMQATETYRPEET